MATKKQFLDYTGLSTLWGIINSTFATKAELTAVKNAAVGSFADAVATADAVTIDAKSINGAVVDTITLSGATTAVAGLMTATDKSTLDSLKETITANTDFKGLKIDNTSIATEIAANLKLDFKTVDDKKCIRLYDDNSTAEALLDVSDFIVDGLLDNAYVQVEGGKPYLYLDFKLANGTTNLEKIDLSTLVDVYTSGEGITISNNAVSLNKATSTTLGGIKIGYTAAEGTKNYAVALDTDGKAYVAVPWVNTEYTTGTQGTYVKVSVDSTTHAINTDETALSTALENLNSDKVDAASGDDYILAKKEGTTITVSANDTLKNAVNAANSAVKTITPGTGIDATPTSATDHTGYTIGLNATTTASLEKADSALQNVTAEGTYIIAGTKTDNTIALTVTDKLKDAVNAAETAVQTVGEGAGITVTKSGTTSTVALSEASAASLGKADTAVQGVKIGDATGVKGTDNVVTFEAEAVVTALGFAALTPAEIYAACGLTYTAPDA